MKHKGLAAKLQAPGIAWLSSELNLKPTGLKSI
jgi:hypothetical protein